MNEIKFGILYLPLYLNFSISFSINIKNNKSIINKVQSNKEN